jgi:hypothetical protein
VSGSHGRIAPPRGNTTRRHSRPPPVFSGPAAADSPQPRAAPISFNLTAGLCTDLQSKLGDYSDALAICLDPATRSRVTIAWKNARRTSLLSALRACAALVRAGINVTDEQRLALGMSPKDREPSPVGPPDTFPLTTLEPQGAARNKMRLSDSATPTRRARPKTAIAAEVRMAVVAAGDPVPAPDATGWTQTRIVTKALTEIEHPESEAGKTLVCQSRWIGTKGQLGPWGPVETGTIAT